MKIFIVKDSIFKRFRKIKEYELVELLLIGKCTIEDKTKYIKVLASDTNKEWFDNIEDANKKLEEINNQWIIKKFY